MGCDLQTEVMDTGEMSHAYHYLVVEVESAKYFPWNYVFIEGQADL